MKLLPLLCLGALLALPSRAVEISVAKDNIDVPFNRIFQMPITASDPAGGPLKFSIVSIRPKGLRAQFAPATNRTLLLNVTGVDSASNSFTGDLALQLFEDLTPKTTARIIDLVSSNFYTGQTFHRVAQSPRICQAGNTNGNTGVSLDDEYNVQLLYDGFGQLGLAKDADFFGQLIDDTGDSEFFITDPDTSAATLANQGTRALDLRYPIFGQLTHGFDVLENIMGTPVTGESPLSPIVINSATITTNSQDAVLRLRPWFPGWTGTVAVTVRAMNQANDSAVATFTAHVVYNTVNDPPFLGPVPASVITTQAIAASFPYTAFDLDSNDNLTPSLDDSNTHNFPVGYDATIAKQRFWLIPDLTTTGTVEMTLGVRDDLHGFDTQVFTATVLPKPDAPTMTILPKRGTLISGTSSNDDRITISGSLGFSDSSDHAFTFEDIVVLDIGDPTNPLHVRLRPDEPAYAAKKGVIRYKSARGTNVLVSAQFSSKKGAFKIAVSNFDFPTAISNQVQTGITVGNDYGTDTRAWVATKPGTFAFPKP